MGSFSSSAYLFASFRKVYDALAAMECEGPLAASRERRGSTNRKAADERAKALASTVRELRRAGIVSLKDLADALNKRKVKTVYGARWHPTTVARLLGRLASSKEHGKVVRRRL